MNKKKLLGVALSAALAFSFSASPANAVVLETESCTLTLPSKVVNVYAEGDSAIPINSADSIKTTFITSDMLVCPSGVVVDILSSDLFVDWLYSNTNWKFYSNKSAGHRAFFQYRTIEGFNSSTNTTEILKAGWTIEGDSATYDGIRVRALSKPYVYVNSEDKYYPLVLAQPFELVAGNTLSSSSCVVTIADVSYDQYPNAGQVLNEGTNVPWSNVKCPSETIGHELGIFSSGSADPGWISDDGFFLAADAYYCRESNPIVSSSGVLGVFEGDKNPLCVPSNWESGKFSKFADGSYVIDSDTGILYPLVLAAPFVVKSATDVTAKVKKKGSYLTIKINADRNDWFNRENGVASYKRQTVMPKDKADRAIVKRGNKVIAVVKLNVFGNGKVKIKDIAGKNNYTVTLVETESNHAGVASFKK